jgi:hypothetical protein
MAGQNVRLANPVIREEAIGSLGVGPILADQWNTLPHSLPHLSQQFAEPFAKPRILKFAPSGFSINPMFVVHVGWGARLSRSRNIKPMERLSIANQVLSNESQVILPTQHFVVVGAP